MNMELTGEQSAIINAQGNIKINAVAGSGKTTTIIEYAKARTFATTFYDYIEKQTRFLLSKMDKGEIEVTHDFYLKKFQLQIPHFITTIFYLTKDRMPRRLCSIFFLNRKLPK